MGTMKVGEEGERSMRPLFPRVHVNDTEKGGPRAPPRNKMALYEQLSIPSQKFSSTTFPPHKPDTMASSASSIQGGTNERTEHSPFYLPHSNSSSSTEKPYSSRSSDGKSNKTRGMQFERSTSHLDYKTSHAAGSGAEGGSSFNVHDFMSGKNSFKVKYDNDDDDFRVPTFAPSEIAPHSKDAPLLEVNKPVCFGATNGHNSTSLDSSIHVLSSSNNPIYEANDSGKLSRKRERIHSEQKSRETISSKEDGDESPNSSEANEILAGPSKVSPAPSDLVAETNMKCFDKTGRRSAGAGNKSSLDVSVENSNACKIRRQSCSGATLGYSQSCYAGKANGSGELKDVERSGEVLEASMVDSIFVSDISPDDVLGVIGPKQFCKARRAIVNQQRVFAIQVFELHRLIKVQKLFATSPHLLLEASDIITIQPKATVKSLPVATPSLKYTDYSAPNPSQNADSPAEKPASSPLLQPREKNPNPELCHLPRNIPLTADSRLNPWCFQPPPNQWLIPVMSPSEGLIYKPYSTPCPPPGFITPLYGACNPLNMPSVSGDFMNSPYGFPSCRPQQSRLLPGAPAIGPNYFPVPYCTPMVNPVISASAADQVSPFTNAKSGGRSVQCSQSSCNTLNTKSKALPDIKLQASTASSLSGKGREVIDLAPAFPVPSAAEGSWQATGSGGKENQTHVIRVIPHNARSATESAARIFRSIQRERLQLDL